jgi:hypothetical protein
VDDLALIEETRDRLLRDLDRVPPDVAEWAPVPGGRTISESLLHVAAVEFIFAAALALRAGREVHARLWEQLKAGLASEVGYDPPQQVGLSGCIERLKAVRDVTRTVVGGDEPAVTETDVRSALEALRERGADISGERLEALVPKLASHCGVGSIGVLLTAHEEYHRGQVLLQNYLAKRLPSAT